MLSATNLATFGHAELQFIVRWLVAKVPCALDLFFIATE